MHLRNSNVMDHLDGHNLRLSSDNILSSGHSPAIDLTTRQSNHHLISKQENSVHIPWRTLLEFGQNNLVRFALIIYKQIDQFIQPNYELFSSVQMNVPTTISSLQGVQQPANTRLQINSDLVGLLLTNEPFLQIIPGTVFITFKHKHNLSSTTNSALHPQTQFCALWNYNLKQWQMDGCQLIESNRTHSTCECNHLSVYALLRSSPADEEQRPNQLSNSNENKQQQDSNLENILTIGGYHWTFYTNQLKALVTSSCYFSILCLGFVIVSLTFIQYRQSRANRLLNKKASINGTLTDLSLNIHYGTYHSSTNNSVAYGSTIHKAAPTKQNQSTFCTHLNLCFVLIVIELLLVCSSKTLPTRLDYENRLNCAIFAALLHYLLLSLFVWLLFDVLILHSNVKHHLNQLNLFKSTDYSLPTISSISPNLASAPKNSISSKWLIAVAYGCCSLLLLISVLIDAQSYGSALVSSGHCFLTNSGTSYLYLLVLPIFILILCITVTSFSTIKSMAKTRYPLSMTSLQPAKLNADLSNSSASIVLNNHHNQHFTTNAHLCKQLKESIVTLIIVSLTWSAALIYLNSAEKLPVPAPNQIGSRSYQLFGILFSALNIAQAAFFVLYYCLLDSSVRNAYYQFYCQLKRSIRIGFNSLSSSFRRKDKVASSLSANTINSTVSNTPSSMLNNGCNQAKQNDLNKSTVNPMIDQFNAQQQQQPIIPPPTSITNQTIKPFYLTSKINASALDEPEKCSMDYGFPPVSLVNGNANRNQFRHQTSALHSYQIANNNLNSSANAYVSKNEQHHPQHHAQQFVEHVYESLDGENPYIAKLLSDYQTLGTHHLLNHQLNQHQLNHLHKTLRPISSIIQQQQHHQQQQQQFSNIYQQQVNSLNSSHGHLRSLSDLSNISERPLLATNKNLNPVSLSGNSTALPAIVRDNTKCSTILPNSFQQLNKMKKFHNTLGHADHFSAQQLNATQQLNAHQLLKESTLI